MSTNTVLFSTGEKAGLILYAHYLLVRVRGEIQQRTYPKTAGVDMLRKRS